MNVRLLIFTALALAVGCSSPKDASRQSESMKASEVPSTETSKLLSYQDQITTDYLRPRLAAFSADSMEGRETAMPGQKKAAKYLTEQYKKLGLKPVGDDNSYLQKFDLAANRTDSVVFKTYKTGKEPSEKKNVHTTVSSKTSSSNYIRRFGGNNKIEGDIVFAGFGIQNKALGIDHLQGLDLSGKWVMVYEDIPQAVQGDTLYTNSRQFSRAWLENILQKGAAGIIVIPEMTEQQFEEAANANQGGYGEPTGMQLAYRAQENGGATWSYLAIKPSQAATLLKLDSGEGLKEVKQGIIENIKDFSPRETGFGLTQVPYVAKITLETENVVAYLEGADPELKDEVVVLSAHYDHVGIGAPDSTGDAIYNGANDDGSGTIGVLGAARAFAKAKENGVQPRRSILFLSVSGEEKGLLGSRYYSDHPIYPMEKTVANINTDMIGRVDPEHRQSGNSDYIYIIGAEIISSDIDSLLKAGNARSGNLDLDMRYNDLEDPNQFYRRSDHWNFGRFGVPFVFFFNGVHEDYHRPSDEIEKMNFDLMTKTVRSMYATTVMVANADSAPEVDNQEFIEIAKEN